MAQIEVFADVACPFTHVGLRRLFARRADIGREDVSVVIRAWPLEIVNGHTLDAHFVAEEVADIRAQAAPDLFAGFREEAFPRTSVPALALTDAAYRVGTDVGERVALLLRTLLFEEGDDVSDPAVLTEVAAAHGVEAPFDDPAPVLADHAEGVARGVVGSPHFFTRHEGFLCPSLDVSRDADGALHVAVDVAGLDHFLSTCFD
jgi:2-hydroxychromene-2-carboxylate isomerase